MSDRTGIEWTDATWNPVRGCTRVSEGCRNCYAESVAARFSGPGLPYEGLARSTPAGPRWTGEVRLIEKHLGDPLRWEKPRRIFVNSMSDLFHEKLSDDQIDRVFMVMALAQQHTYQVLTKRPGRMHDYMAALPRRLAKLESLLHQSGYEFVGGLVLPLPNVWLGVSVEHQDAADERIPQLMATPAAVRFISAEPLLGSVDLEEWLGREVCTECGASSTHGPDSQAFEFCADETVRPCGLDWVICGGESGRGARPMHPDWTRLLRDQCESAGVPFFFKQWGEWEPVRALYGGDEEADNGRGELDAVDLEGTLYPPNIQPPPGTWLMERVGKKRAGALLDGREWREFPRAAAPAVMP